MILQEHHQHDNTFNNIDNRSRHHLHFVLDVDFVYKCALLEILEILIQLFISYLRRWKNLIEEFESSSCGLLEYDSTLMCNAQTNTEIVFIFDNSREDHDKLYATTLMTLFLQST